MGDFLLGYVSDFQLSNVWVADQRHWAAMFYVQDDWKVNSKLALNLGLRYDFITPALNAKARFGLVTLASRSEPLLLSKVRTLMNTILKDAAL